MHNSNSVSYTNNSSMNHVAQLEEMNFLDVVDINDLICSISQEIMQDPVQLSCGHIFNRPLMTKKYLETKTKICPHPECAKPYTFLEENSFLKQVVTSCLNVIQQSKQYPAGSLRKQFIELYNAIPESQEKGIIKQAIDLFLQGDAKEKEQAQQKVADIIIGIQDPFKEGPYLAVFQLMTPSSSHVANNQESLAQQVDQPISQGNAEYYARQLKGVKFLTIIKAHQLMCPIITAKCPDQQLIPCGHHFSFSAIFNSFIRKKNKKICPLTTCSKPYTFAIKDMFMAKVTGSVYKIINRPDKQLENKLMSLYHTLPESPDKQKIKEAIDLFLDLRLNRASEKMIEVILANSNGSLYEPILNLVEEHKTHAGKKVRLLREQDRSSAVSNSPSQTEATPNTTQADTQNMSNSAGIFRGVQRGIGVISPQWFTNPAPTVSASGIGYCSPQVVWNPVRSGFEMQTSYPFGTFPLNTAIFNPPLPPLPPGPVSPTDASAAPRVTRNSKKRGHETDPNREPATKHSRKNNDG